MKMKQCTLFLPQEATWAISNVTAGPKEQIQVKKYQYLRMHQAKWLYLLHSYLLPTNYFSSTVGLELAKSGLCNHCLQRILRTPLFVITNLSLYKCMSFKC